MAHAGDSAERMTRRIRWIARIWGLVIIGITVMMLTAHLVVPDPHAIEFPPTEYLLLLAMCLSVAGLGVAWRWEGLGGAINVGFFLVHLGLYWALRGRFFPLWALATFTPVLIPGVLFLVCWWRTRKPKQT